MIIDFHTHVFSRFFREGRSDLISREKTFGALYGSPRARLAGVEDLIRNMDEDGVRKSVIFGFPWEAADRFRRHNDYILESVNRYPDRLIGFCCFSPKSPEGPREVERCMESGLSGVGELAVYEAGLTPKVTEGLGEVMSLCSRFDVPFLLHTNEPVGHDYPGKAPMTLRQIYGFLKTYPSNRIVLAHWGGGLFFYGIMKREMRETLQNVWFDTAASPYLYRPDVYRIAGETIGFGKILLGSDFPLIKPERYLSEMESAGIPETAVRQIKGLNALELLGISK